MSSSSDTTWWFMFLIMIVCMLVAFLNKGLIRILASLVVVAALLTIVWVYGGSGGAP